MSTAEDVKKALVACAEAELGRKITREETSELIQIFNSTKRQSASERVSSTLDQFAEGKSRQLTESVTASDNISRKMKDLENAIKEWVK